MGRSMKWKKLGHIYNPDDYVSNFQQKMGYGANPVPLHLENGIYRIFYNVRDIQNRSYITYLDYDVKRGKMVSAPGKILVAPGPRGTFDDSGCSMGSILDLGDICYIYYLGWNLLTTVPWMNTIGMAIYDKKSDTCKKVSAAPILDRSNEDPLSISYPFVLKQGNFYHMWYGSHLDWGTCVFRNHNYDFNHVIKYAWSEDGIHFHRDGKICIQGDGKIEYAFARPTVLLENGIYRMWYTYRGEKYRIGYAESTDRTNWTRKDYEAGIQPSASDWEDGALCYPTVFRHGETLYMLYCGKGYGQTGFGIAKLVSEDSL